MPQPEQQQHIQQLPLMAREAPVTAVSTDKAILSLNDHPDIRRVFARFQMDTTGINYIVGGGGRGRRAQRADHLQLGP